MKKYKLILIIIWMGVIFMLSNQPARESGELSDNFIDNTIVKVYEIFNGKVNEEKRIEIIDKYSYSVRKCAHFTVYFILGILCFIFFKDFTKHYVIYSILVCFLYACSDEFHQYFIKGRCASFLDVTIDTLGAVFSIIISRLIVYKKHKNML